MTTFEGLRHIPLVVVDQHAGLPATELFPQLFVFLELFLKLGFGALHANVPLQILAAHQSTCFDTNCVLVPLWQKLRHDIAPTTNSKHSKALQEEEEEEEEEEEKEEEEEEEDE